MILIFKGYGLLVPFIFLGCFVLAEIASLVLAERAGNGEWVLGAALACAGIICWFLGHWLKHKGSLLHELRKSRQVGPEYCLRPFFWIKMEWWGPIFLVLGLLFLMPGPTQTSEGHPKAPPKQSSELVGGSTKESPQSEPVPPDRSDLRPGTNSTSTTPASSR